MRILLAVIGFIAIIIAVLGIIGINMLDVLRNFSSQYLGEPIIAIFFIAIICIIIVGVGYAKLSS